MPLDQIVRRPHATRRPRRTRSGREKIREFADAIGDDNPAYRDPEAARALGHPDVIAPPTFAHRAVDAAGRQVDRRPRARASTTAGSCTASSGSSITRPIRAGDRLTVTVTVETIRTAAGNDMHHHPRRRHDRGRRAGLHRVLDAGRARPAGLTCRPDAAVRRRRGRHRAAGADASRSTGPTWCGTPAPPATSTRSTGTSGSPPRSACPNVIAHGMFTMAEAARVRHRLGRRPGRDRRVRRALQPPGRRARRRRGADAGGHRRPSPRSSTTAGSGSTSTATRRTARRCCAGPRGGPAGREARLS